MLPRIVYRTHYQAIGFDLFDLAILEALSPVGNEQRHSLEERLSRLATSRLRPFNPRAAGYLIDELHGLGICTRNYVLAPLAVGYRAVNLRRDGAARRWFYLTHFIPADGAMLVELVNMLSTTQLRLSQFYDSPRFDELLLRIYEFYLLETPEIREKIAIRADITRLSSIKTSPRRGTEPAGLIGLEPKTRKHKVMFHVRALVDLGLVFCETGRLTLTASGVRFRDVAPDLATLEKLNRSRGYVEGAITYILGLTEVPVRETDVVDAYRAIRSLDIPLVSVDSVLSSINSMYAGEGKIVRRSALETALDDMRRARGSGLRIYRQSDSDYGSINFDAD